MRAKNGTVPRYFDKGYKSTYKKQSDKIKLLEAVAKQAQSVLREYEATEFTMTDLSLDSEFQTLKMRLADAGIQAEPHDEIAPFAGSDPDNQ